MNMNFYVGISVEFVVIIHDRNKGQLSGFFRRCDDGINSDTFIASVGSAGEHELRTLMIVRPFPYGVFAVSVGMGFGISIGIGFSFHVNRCRIDHLVVFYLLCHRCLDRFCLAAVFDGTGKGRFCAVVIV